MTNVGVQKGTAGEDGFKNKVQEVAKMGPRWAKMRPRREKMSPISVAIAGRFAVFAKVKQCRGKEGPRMYF